MGHAKDSLQAAHRAIEVQSWVEARALLDSVDPAGLGALVEDFDLLRATCLRHQGDLDGAERVYTHLRSRLALTDPRVPDVVLGLAELAHLRGDFPAAARLAQAAWHIPTNDRKLSLRVAVCAVHIDSHLNVDRAAKSFEHLLGHYAPERSTLWANVLFNYADALIVAGDYEHALPRLLEANQLAADTGATITLADSMRRLPLVRILLGQDSHALRGVGDLSLAEQLYEASGDRGGAYLHTEAGEVYRAIGRYREAERHFKKGLWAVTQIDDRNRMAHNHLGLFEVSRTAGAEPKWDELEQALGLYRQIGSQWGIVHCGIARALADAKPQKILPRVLEQIDASTFSAFARERALVERLQTMRRDQLVSEPHLMNWP